MADAVEMREDGEIESDEGEIYNKIERPQQEVAAANTHRERYNSESSGNSDSDGETPHKFMKRLEKPQPPVATGSSKNGHLWKNMLQEESLMENLKTCDVSVRKRKYERGAESYDFENASRMLNNDDPRDLRAKLKRRKTDLSGNESSSSNASSHSRKRARKHKNRNRLRRESKILPDLLATLDNSDDVFAHDMAEKLEEEKPELIVRVVSVIGREASLNLYKITQKIEREGGMLTMNKLRRRTPGGIFLFLLKTSDKIDEDLKREVFDKDKKTAADRKMSSEQMSKDPPNSPANPELLENGKLTDPDLVSQKILNFTNPSDDALELDYNDDMDTF